MWEVSTGQSLFDSLIGRDTDTLFFNMFQAMVNVICRRLVNGK